MSELKFSRLFVRSPLLAVAIWLQRPFFRGRLMKLGFPVIEDDQKIGTEWVWCKRLGYDLFEVANMPILVRGIAFGDIVSGGFSNVGWLADELRIESEYANAWVVAEHLDLNNVWSQLTDGLDLKFEFASAHRVSVAGSDEAISILKDRVKADEKMLFEKTA